MFPINIFFCVLAFRCVYMCAYHRLYSVCVRVCACVCVCVCVSIFVFHCRVDLSVRALSQIRTDTALCYRPNWYTYWHQHTQRHTHTYGIKTHADQSDMHCWQVQTLHLQNVNYKEPPLDLLTDFNTFEKQIIFSHYSTEKPVIIQLLQHSCSVSLYLKLNADISLLTMTKLGYCLAGVMFTNANIYSSALQKMLSKGWWECQAVGHKLLLVPSSGAQEVLQDH